MENKYTKLSALVGDTFTIEKVGGYVFKHWDNVERRMITRDTYAEGFSKKYPVDTDKGTLDLSSAQIGQCLEATVKDGIANLNGQTFTVKSNGKEGMEIRYYINLAKVDVEERGDDSGKDEAILDDDLPDKEDADEDVDLSSIPF